jgi:hypothetical protein
MYNLIIGLKLKRGTYIDEDCIKYLSKICCYIIGKEKNKFKNCASCEHNNISEVKMPSGKIALIANASEANCLFKESFMVHKDEIKIYVNSSFYDVVNKLIQELFKLDSIHISQYEFEIYDIELVNLDRIKEERRKIKVSEDQVIPYNVGINEKEVGNLAYNV